MTPRLRGAALLAALLLAGCRREEATGPAAAGGAAARTERAVVQLHFPAEDGYLRVEKREMQVPAEADGRIEAIVGALLGGPRERGLLAVFPAGVELGGVYVDPHGTAYVDLAAEGQPAPPPSGSALELVRVYSLVNTVLANEPRARGVVLLWNGTQRQTFAGHVDTLRPLTADHGLVR